MDVFYCHVNGFGVHKVQQDLHGGGGQPLDIHVGFIFLRELEIRREAKVCFSVT